MAAIAVVVGLVAFVRAISGSDAADPRAATQPVVDATTPGSATLGSEGPGTDQTGEPVVTAARVPTAADPARVLLVGDSEAGGLSPFLESALKPAELTALTTDYKVSSGFVRNDFYDWPAHLRETVLANNPDIVVALFGANDGQPFTDMANKAVDSPEWRAEYGKRISEAMDYLSADGRTLIWVGVPNGNDPNLAATLPVQNSVVEEQIATHPNVIFVDTWNHFSGIDGSFAPLVLDPRDGSFVAVRSGADGFHLNTIGEKILALYVTGAVDEVLVARGGVIPADAAPPTTVDPAGVGRYTIAEGDSLSKIASTTGTSVAAIVTQNGWENENHLIYPGMKIELPAKSAG